MSPPSRSVRPRRLHVLAVVLGAGGCVLAGCSSGTPTAKPPAKKTPATVVTEAPSTTTTAPSGPQCPLTGTPAPGGSVPKRPAQAVKVDNYPTARPQAGLTKADIVFEEPVEGGITRLAAVFQCQGATLVGPVRSARNIDIGILGQLDSPLLVHVGGINPVLANIKASPLKDVELGNITSAIKRVPGRVAPYSTFTSTTTIWQLRSTDTTPPPALFGYSTAVPAGNAANTVSIPFSSYSEVVWRYDASAGDYLRYYRTTPAKLLNGSQIGATNVVVQFIHTYLGPWVENTEGGLEVQANLYTHASGPAMVFRNGVEVTGQWSRTGLTHQTKFATTGGTPINLAPGTTWVELVPVTVNVTTTTTTASAAG